MFLFYLLGCENVTALPDVKRAESKSGDHHIHYEYRQCRLVILFFYVRKPLRAFTPPGFAVARCVLIELPKTTRCATLHLRRGRSGIRFLTTSGP